MPDDADADDDKEAIVRFALMCSAAVACGSDFTGFDAMPHTTPPVCAMSMVTPVRRLFVHVGSEVDRWRPLMPQPSRIGRLPRVRARVCGQSVFS